jgi:hypothetical protein
LPTRRMPALLAGLVCARTEAPDSPRKATMRGADRPGDREQPWPAPPAGVAAPAPAPGLAAATHRHRAHSGHRRRLV